MSAFTSVSVRTRITRVTLFVLTAVLLAACVPPPDDPAPVTYACEWWDYIAAFIYAAITLAGGVSLAIAGGIRTGAAWMPEWVLARGNRAIGETFLGLLIVVGGLGVFGWMVSNFFGETVANCWETGASAALIGQLIGIL